MDLQSGLPLPGGSSRIFTRLVRFGSSILKWGSPALHSGQIREYATPPKPQSQISKIFFALIPKTLSLFFFRSARHHSDFPCYRQTA